MPLGDRSPRYCIADLVIDVGRRSVQRGASEIHLSKLSFDVLRALIEAAPNVVSNDELTRRVWKGVVVGPESVTQRVKLLRDALGDDPEAPRYIVGLRGQGYRVLPPVTLDSETSDASRPEAQDSIKGRTRPRMVGIVLGATALAVAVAYVAIDQLLVSKYRAGSPPVMASKESTSHATAASGTSGTPEMAPMAPPPHSIAVLPFLNMSGDAKQDYFSDGLTEELLNSLSRINELQVAARTSSFSFKGKDTDVATIARKLNVGAVLEGSVRRSGRKIRVTAQLNNAVTGFHLWSQTYDRDLGDVLKLQTEIANAVVGALKVTLLGDETAKIELGGTHNPAAFDAYLRAAKAARTHTNDAKGWQTAIAAFTEAIGLDPNYALAFAGRSFALTAYAEGFATGPQVRESFDRAQADARKALALAPDLAEGHLALARFFASGALDFVHTQEEYGRAMALAPGNVTALSHYGRFAALLGRADAGIAAAQHAVRLDPLNPASHAFLGATLLHSDRYREAIAAFQDALALDPDSKWVYGERGIAYYFLGDLQSARSSCEVKPEILESQICLAVTYDKLGRHTAAEEVLAKLRAANGDNAAEEYVEIYAAWGNTSKALEWLDTAVRMRDPGLVDLRTDRFMDPLRKEPRFQAIERALRFPD